mmetsp:Transcript_18055/g.34493  ORF Transcript_18055/g.34493 Transcript_18055/m.34493 type:complete len:510 (+) Transcript_18055:67-1596(+)
MIRVHSTTNGGIAAPSLYQNHESPLGRVLKFGRRRSNIPSGLYDDLASVDSCDDYLGNLKQQKLQQLSKDGGKLSLNKKEIGDKSPSLLSLDASTKAKTDEPGVQGISSAIDKLLFVLSSDDEREDGPLLHAERERAAFSPPASPPSSTTTLRKRTKPRIAAKASKTDSVESLLIPSRHIMSPRRRPRTKVCSPRTSRKPKVGGSDRLCKTDHEALRKKTYQKTGILKSSSAHPLAPSLEVSPKAKKEHTALDVSSEVKLRERKSAHSSTIGRSNPKTSPRSSSKSTLKRDFPRISAELASPMMIQAPPLLAPATTPCYRMRRRSSTGSPALVTLDESENPRRSRNHPITPIRRSKPRPSSRRNKTLEKVEEAPKEGPGLEIAKPPNSMKKAQIQPKRRNSLYISMYNSVPLLKSVSDTTEESTYMTPNQSSHSEQSYGEARTGWVPSPSGHRRHLEISWNGNQSAPALLAASDISESNESDACKFPSARTEWFSSASGHRRHLEISWD